MRGTSGSLNDSKKNIILKMCSHTLYASSAKHNEQRPMRHDNSENQRAPNQSNETHLSHVSGRVTGKAKKKAKAAGALRNIASGNAENKGAIAAACGIEQLFCGVFSFCVGRA